eukprot:CAMPEP_0178899218 /NCGR_PEP_ID=MMETSP0786-20121207/2773_1 /TAXON_ID=186022 /ORGANISM="Thalassionema frauenfeldii, Strain CCMP 1798" /LENGTH=997 /DNA_ID=CAMNT_0020570041 /DNA_START=32 /DNA_END=3025 /DNA_ORIENTATION=-
MSSSTEVVESTTTNNNNNNKNEEKDLEWPMDRVRATFIEFFVKHSDSPHVFWPSSPCVPHDDPTLLFTNAGMNQYKSKFLGTCDPSLPLAGVNRAVNSQKCIRAGGKHNDLDDVGKDVYHHTFFEMLGNWSFGDYFKAGAIDMAWKCLTEEFKLDPERLYATYFGGDESSPCDDEARELWLKYLPAERVLPFDAKDNFWEMGATGPCGPCTEIHYDRIGGRDAAALVNADLPDVIEIWNNVFIQYNREADRSLRPLPEQHIDTGMGLERLVSILQNVDSNYDTDIFLPLFAKIQELTGAAPYSGKVGKEDEGFKDMAYRVVADHIRTLCFAISDGASPSNDGRGYVLRRVLRRAVRYGRQNLGAELGFFAQLVPACVELMGNTFPELKEKQEHVTNIIREEEESFGRTLDKGLVKFQEMAANCKDGVFPGDDAHFLYTTMGFPIDLTELMAEEIDLKVDMEGFQNKMKEEQALSKKAHDEKMMGGSGKDMRLVAEQTATLVNTYQVGATQDEHKYVWNQSLADCTVKAVFVGRNETEDKIGFVQSASSEVGTLGLILDQSSFYAEAGGQVYDTGTIVSSSSSGTTLQVENVQLYGQFVLHVGTIVSGESFHVGDTVTCHVDYERRSPIASNHTMTHVLNYALKDALITNNPSSSKSSSSSITSVDQKGSLVDDAKLRFDFSWNAPLTQDQLEQVEAMVNGFIEKELPVQALTASLGQAQQISALRAVFGETYPDPVRVVSVGGNIEQMLEDPTSDQWNSNYSIEFCGGTHLSNTKEARHFCLLTEEGIAKGIRRIVGVTQEDAVAAHALGQTLTQAVTEAGETTTTSETLEQDVKRLTIQVNESKVSLAIKMALRQVLQEYSQQVTKQKKEKAAEEAKVLVAQALELAQPDADKVVLPVTTTTLDGKIAKAVTQAFGKQNKTHALLLLSKSEDGDRVTVVAAAPKGHAINCQAWIKEITDGMEGAKGGGKALFAQSTMGGEHWEALLAKTTMTTTTQ